MNKALTQKNIKDINTLIKQNDYTGLDDYLSINKHIDLNNLTYSTKNKSMAGYTMTTDGFIQVEETEIKADVLFNNAKYLTMDTLAILKKHNLKTLGAEYQYIMHNLIQTLRYQGNIKLYSEIIHSNEYAQLFKTDMAIYKKDKHKSNFFLSQIDELMSLFLSPMSEQLISIHIDFYKKQNIKLIPSYFTEIYKNLFISLFMYAKSIDSIENILSICDLDGFIKEESKQSFKTLNSSENMNTFMSAIYNLKHNNMFLHKIQINNKETTLMDFFMIHKFPLFFNVIENNKLRKNTTQDVFGVSTTPGTLIFDCRINWYVYNTLSSVAKAIPIKDMFHLLTIHYGEHEANSYLMYLLNISIIKGNSKLFKELVNLKPIPELSILIDKYKIPISSAPTTTNLNLLEYSLINGSSKTIINHLANYFNVSDENRYFLLEDMAGNINYRNNTACAEWLIKDKEKNDQAIKNRHKYLKPGQQINMRDNQNTLSLFLFQTGTINNLSLGIFKKLIKQYMHELETFKDHNDKSLLTLINEQKNAQLTSWTEKILLNMALKKPEPKIKKNKL